MSQINNPLTEQQQQLVDIGENWGWIMAAGVLLVVLGVIGLSMEATMTVATMLYVGILALFAGVGVLVGAFRAEGWKNKLWHVFIGLLYLAAGLVMITNPEASAVWMTLFMAAFLIVIGVTRLFVGFSMRGIEGWGWTVAAGVAAVILGLLIFAEWPISGAWAIGLFVSVDFLMQGISLISIAWAARKYRINPAAAAA